MAKRKKEYDTYDAMTGTFSGSKTSKSSSRSSSVVYDSMSGSFSNVSPQKRITTVKSDTKPKTTQPLQTVKSTMPSVNKDGYEKTNKKYGDYDYHNYSTLKNYDIYKKDNKAYYYDPKSKTYVDMDQPRITTKEQDEKEKKEALKQGFKGNEINKVKETTKLVPKKQGMLDKNSKKQGMLEGERVVTGKKIEQVLPRTYAEQVELDTSGLTKKEKKQFAKDLIRQEKKEGKKLSYVRKGNNIIDELSNTFVNPRNNFQKQIGQPLADAERIYRQGVLNNELALEYYNKMTGKKNNVSKAQRNMDLYNKFNKDLVTDENGNPAELGLVGNTIQNLNTQVESMKKQGIAATAGGIIGGGIGALAGLKSGNVGGGAVAGARIGSKLGYVTGSTPYMYKLEAGNQYKELTDMGVSHKKAKQVAELTGVINASIESGENIADLAIIGGGKLARNQIVSGAISKNESIIGKIIKNLGRKDAERYFEKIYGKEVANSLLKSYVTNVASEGGEEALQETVGILGKRSAAKSEGIEYENTVSDDLQQIGKAGMAGAGSALILGGAQSIATNTASFGANKLSQMAEVINQTNNGEISQEQANQKFEQINNGTYEENKNIDQIAAQQRDAIDQAVQTGQLSQADAAQEIKALDNTLTSERERVNAPQNQVQTREQLPTNTEDKLQNFRNSVANENVEDSEGFYKAAEKIIQDKDYNVILDSSITNENGESVNAVISNEDGITIRINPKSERAGEILLAHEITHGIETKEMSDLIVDYASKNAEFNEALESLKETYGTEDVTPEVVADISGQLLGHQEFINSLRTGKPNLFKRIYDKIIEIANKITGNSKEALFVRDLKNKWEKAYRESTVESAQQNLKESAKYSMNSELSEISNVFSDKKNIETNRNTNNEGETLSKGQQDYFDDSKARDENGALVKVYHTVNHPIVQFNEFNPVGTPGYRFGDQVVIYASASKDMSGSYANQFYEMADTQRLNNIEDVENWFYEVGLPFYEVSENTVYDDEGAPILKYKTEDELLRNIKSDMQREIGDTTNLQYEGYLKIKNPYIVESQGQEWNSVEERYDETRAKLYDNTIKNKKQALIDLVSESKNKQKQEYEDKDIRRQIELASGVLQEFNDNKFNAFFNKVGVGSDILELHESFRDAKNYKDFLERVNQKDENGKSIYNVNIELPSASEKMSNLINEETIDHYKNSKIGEKFPVLNNLDNKTFGEFMDELLNLYETEGVYGTADRYFWFNMDKVFRDEDVSDIIEPSEWIEAVDLDFNQEAKEMLSKKTLTTNDVVKLIIEENKQKSESEKYDGIIFKGIYDYGGDALFETPEDVYVVFNSNQFKAADNLNPTSDPDIRYSQKTDKWQQWLNENFPSRGTTTVLKDKINKNKASKNVPATKNENVISADSITKDFDNAKNGKLDDKKIRSYIGTSNEATGMQKTIKKADVDKITYEVQSNQKTYKTAQNNIKDLSYDERVSRSKNILNSNKKVTAVDMAEAQIALLEAAQSGNVEDYLNLQQDIAIMGTELGQTIQAMSMIQKMSPDGQIATLLKIVNRKQKTGNKAWEGVKLNPDLVQKVLDSYDDVSHTTYNQEQMEQAVDELKQDLADQMKVSRTEKLNEWRYLSMLGNPKTHIRNLAGNVAMSVVKSIKDEISAAGQDVSGALGLINKEQKTATLKRASKEVKDLSDVAFKEMMRVDDKGSKYVDAGIIEQRRKIFNNKVLEFLRKGNLKALNVEDNWFKKAHFKKSFSTYLTAKGISTVEDINKNPQIVADAKVYAMNEAKIATFQQDNAVADWIRDLDKLGKGAEVIRGAIVPFTGVPMNIAKTGIEYAPGTGMLKTISDFRKAPKGEKGIVLIDGLAKQMTGSALAILGYALAKAGFVTADAGDDKEDKYQKDLGAKMNYSIKFGDTSYDVSWLSPSSMPFFVGASAYEQWEKNEGLDANFVTEALTSTIDPLSEMSVISSFTDIMKGFSQNDAEFFKNAGEKSIQSYLSQYLPTVFSQFSRALDSKKRNTYADKNSKWKFGEETGKQLAYKTPFRFLLPEQTDYFGNTKMDEENNLSRGLQSFLSPVNVKKDTSNKVSKELMKLYKETGDSEVIPGKSDNYVDYKNEKYEMTQREYNKFKKDYGTLATKEINRALEDTKYQELSKDKKAQVISNILKYSKFKAKDNFLSSKGVDYTNTQFNKAKQAQESGYAIADYYITKKVTAKEKSETASTNRYMEMKNKGIDGRTFDEFKAFVSTARADKTRNGGYVPGSKKQKIINYIQGLPLSAKQKQALWEDYQKNTGSFQYYK